jgi:hypothetical protein
LGTGTLDENVRASKLKGNKLKFPCEGLNENIFYDDLQKTEPFKHERFYSSLSKSNISEEEEPMNNEKTKKEKREKGQFQVKVFVFNSRKFDTNLFVRNISDPNISVEQLIGSIDNYKSLIISHKLYSFNLQFLDLKLFLGTRWECESI